jgi:hypothetical protein
MNSRISSNKYSSSLSCPRDVGLVIDNDS